MLTRDEHNKHCYSIKFIFHIMILRLQAQTGQHCGNDVCYQCDNAECSGGLNVTCKIVNVSLKRHLKLTAFKSYQYRVSNSSQEDPVCWMATVAPSPPQCSGQRDLAASLRPLASLWKRGPWSSGPPRWLHI